MWTMGGCIGYWYFAERNSNISRCSVYTGIRLLLLIYPFISSFFFLSNFQTFKIFLTLFSGTIRPTKFKHGIHVDNRWLYHVYWNQNASTYSFFYFVIFLSLRFSNIKKIVTLFSETVRHTKLKLGTHMDSWWMYCVYQNQAVASYLSLYSSFLFPIFKD